MDIEISTRGPLFDGRAEAAMHAYTREVERYIADKAVSRIRAYLPTQYMYLGHHGGTPEDNPVPPNAGWLQANIIATEQVDDVVVTDNDVVYGPWIEGVSSRNMTSRFKGYHTFRLIGQQLEMEAGVLAEEIIGPYLREMND